MNAFEKVVNWLRGTMEVPTGYGWFHFMWVGIVIIIIALLCIFGRKLDDKKARIVLGVFWGMMVLFEIYKQIVFAFNYDGTKVSWDYAWYAFPFQFCSTPMYVLPFAIFLKDGKIRNGALTYLATYSLFAGICVFCYPNDVFTDLIGINIQTMFHHGSQIIVGVYVAVRYSENVNIKSYLYSICYFVGLSAVAFIFNVTIGKALTNHTFNLFFIGPIHPSTLPVLSGIYPKVPYVIFLIIYVFGFSLCGAIVLGIKYAVSFICGKIKPNKLEIVECAE